MSGPWDIKTPPAIFPVRPGDALQDRKAPPKRPQQDDDKEDPPRSQDESQDDGSGHIDDYA